MTWSRAKYKKFVCQVNNSTLVLFGDKNRTHVKKLWKTLSRDTSKLTEVKQALVLAVPSTKMRKLTTSGMTVMELQSLLDVLGNRVHVELRMIVEATFARYMAGDRSMIIEVDLNATVHEQIPSLNYNFKPPTSVYTTQ
jgi:hypothetical protein